MYYRCSSFCTASSYQLMPLSNFFKNKGYRVKLYRKVLHVTSQKKSADIFIFSYGCLVSWGLYQKEEKEIINQIYAFSIDPIPKIEKDYFAYKIGKITEMRVHKRFTVDIIMLESDNVQIKLAISHGLAQSVQLEFYEDVVQRVIAKNIYLTDELASQGKISLSRRLITRRMGEIFNVKSSVNLSSEYLEVPEYFWEHSNIETYYNMTAKFFDISRRVETLNQKLNVLHELFEMLTSQLQHRDSNYLEITIILLIFIEIIVNAVFAVIEIHYLI